MEKWLPLKADLGWPAEHPKYYMSKSYIFNIFYR